MSPKTVNEFCSENAKGYSSKKSKRKGEKGIKEI